MQPTVDLNDIRIFAATVNAGSMSSAAKLLGLPTSTISRSIARLQRQLRIALIINTKAGVALTDAGREYLPSCHEALRLLRDGQELLTRQVQQPAGSLRVACPITMAREVMAPLMPALARRHDELQVELLPYTRGRDGVPQVDSDLFFYIVPSDSSTGVMRSFPATRRGIYISTKYASSAGIPAHPEDLSSFHCLGSRGTFAQWVLRSSDREVRLELEFAYLAADPGTLRNLLLEGLGVTMLPVWMALEPGTAEHLIRILPEWEPAPVGLFVTSAKGDLAEPKISAFLAFMREHLGTELDPRATGKNVSDCFAENR